MEIKINKEIRNYKEAIFFGLTFRQFIYTILACATALIVHFLLKNVIDKGILSWICLFSASPFVAMAFLNYNGMKANEFVMNFIKTEFLTPKVLFFKPDNIYYMMYEEKYLEARKEELNNDKISRKNKEYKKRKKDKGKNINS